MRKRDVAFGNCHWVAADGKAFPFGDRPRRRSQEPSLKRGSHAFKVSGKKGSWRLFPVEVPSSRQSRGADIFETNKTNPRLDSFASGLFSSRARVSRCAVIFLPRGGHFFVSMPILLTRHPAHPFKPASANPFITRHPAARGTFKIKRRDDPQIAQIYADRHHPRKSA